jgi:ribosome biogenesis GTPase
VSLNRETLFLAGLDGNGSALHRARLRTVRSAGIATPTVGDWVLARRLEASWWVEKILPRTSCFIRKAAGRRAAVQLLAANVDRVLVVTAVGGDLSARRLERYLVAAWAGGAEPVVVVNKVDRAHDFAVVQQAVSQATSSRVPVLWTSALTGKGLQELTEALPRGDTVAFVGSSGVGKSSLINAVLGREQQRVLTVRGRDDTGRHATTERELIAAPSGTLLIDTPGMREFGVWDADAGLAVAFADIVELAEQCRFRDCAHGKEPGCAVREATENGLLPQERLSNYQRLAQELVTNSAKSHERARLEGKKRWKAVSKQRRAWLRHNGGRGFKG